MRATYGNEMAAPLLFVTSDDTPETARAELVASLAPGAHAMTERQYGARRHHTHDNGRHEVVIVDLAPDAVAKLRSATIGCPIVALAREDAEELALLRSGADDIAERSAASVAATIERVLARRAAYVGVPRIRRHNEALGHAARRMRELGHESLEVQLAALTELGARELDIARASVWLYDESRSAIEAADVYDVRTGTHERGAVLDAATYPAYFAALRKERTIAVRDAHSDPRTRAFEEGYLAPTGIGAMLDVPIRVGNRTLGVLCFEHVGDPRPFSDFDESVAAGLADFIALMLENDARRRAVESFRESLVALERARRIEAVGRVAGGIAHDFNNMLTVILNYAEVLSRKLGPEHPLAPLVAEIARAGHHATDMTRKLLSVSRSNHAPRRTFDLVACLLDLERFLTTLVGERVTMKLELEEAPVPVQLEPSELEQIVMNLAINGRDAMTEGGTLTIEARREGPNALIRVRDTGHGMSPEVRDRIFEPFFTTKEREKGTGLGLYTVYNLVRQTGGSMKVESERGAGTAFEVRLPLSSDDTPAANAEPPEASLRGSETIVVAEDEATVREVLSAMLRELGYHVLPAKDGPDAIRTIAEHAGPVHLLLTDVVMPLQSGPELARELKQRRPEIKVLFVSGYDDDALRAYGLESDCALLRKPVVRDTLGVEVRRALGPVR